MKCPYCANEIKEWAIKCQFCKEFLDWRNSPINNKDGGKDILNKILLTILFISFIIMIIWWIDVNIYNINQWYEKYWWTYSISSLVFFCILIYYSIKYVWKNRKYALITIWSTTILFIISLLLYNRLEDNSCEYIWDVFYCHVRGWSAFRSFLMLYTGFISILSIIIFILRLIWWWYKKNS